MLFHKKVADTLYDNMYKQWSKIAEIGKSSVETDVKIMPYQDMGYASELPSYTSRPEIRHKMS